MPSAWSRGGVWCRAGTEAFSNLSCEMLNPKKLQAPRSHPSLWAASAHGPGCASEEGLGWFSLHPASSKADHGLFFWQQDGRHAWKTSSKHPLPLASTAVSDPKSTSRAQQLHPQPCCSHFGQHCSVLSFSFPGMSHGHGDSCTGMDMVMPLGCCCGLVALLESQKTAPSPGTSDHLCHGTASLHNSCNTRGERIAFFPSPDCRAGTHHNLAKGEAAAC